MYTSYCVCVYVESLSLSLTCTQHMPTPPGWAANMAAVQTAIVAKDGFDWQNFRSIGSPKSQG